MKQINSQSLYNLHGLSFTKMHGCGNDFILINNYQSIINTNLMPLIAQGLCSRNNSVGADGLIFIEPSNRIDQNFGPIAFQWHFFNMDGSSAEMCGNGGRCAARFAFDKKLANATMVFDTKIGPIRAWVNNNFTVKIEMSSPIEEYKNLKLKKTPKNININTINTGVPHAVILCDNINNIPFKKWSKLIRFHQYFAPIGINVNFVSIYNKILYIRTYERGVENETLACGTGAVASALIIGINQKLNSPIKVKVKNGEELTVYYKYKNKKYYEVYLEGITSYVYEGYLHKEAFAWMKI